MSRFAERALAEDADIAAVILEPSGAGWGGIPLPEGRWSACARATSRHGAVLIFDEVVTGFRWAPGGVQEVAGITPDLTAAGKIVAGGMPGGALAGQRASVMELLEFRDDPGWRKVNHPGTHNAHRFRPLPASPACSSPPTAQRSGGPPRQRRNCVSASTACCAAWACRAWSTARAQASTWYWEYPASADRRRRARSRP